MKINIIQFDPVIGGETTLTNALSEILRKEYEIRVLTPVHLSKKGIPKVDKKWGKVKGAEYLSYEQVKETCEDADFIFCVNAKHVKGSVKSDKRELAQADSDLFFGQFHGKNFIFYEHGFHTWRLYNYERLFSNLIKQDNTIRVLTNTKMAIEFYASKGYNAYLCRQPFNTDLYGPIKSNSGSKINICFNSRYSATKGPYVILRQFMPFFGKGLNFNLQFRGNISDPVSVWHNIDGVLLKDVMRSHPEISFLGFADQVSEIYNEQDFCIYAGYQTREERGKIEYAILEPIFYDIPLIVAPEVFEHFKYEEYEIAETELRSCFIEATPDNLQKIIDGKFDFENYTRNAHRILEDFLPHKILERFKTCITSPASKGRSHVELF
jgi:hypothetical protein